jgi:hypothetical protein
MQISLVEAGDTTSGSAKRFYAAVGVKDAAAFKPAAPVSAAKDAPPRAWAVEYSCGEGGATFGWPLSTGTEPRTYPKDVADKVCGMLYLPARCSLCACIMRNPLPRHQVVSLAVAALFPLLSMCPPL